MPCDIFGGQCGAWGNKSIWPSNCQTANMCQNSSNLQKQPNSQKLPKVPKTAKMPKTAKNSKSTKFHQTAIFVKKHSIFRGWPPDVTRIPYGPGATMSVQVLCVVPASPGGARWPPLAFPGFFSVLQPDKGPGALPSLLQPAQGPGALTSCSASPGMVPCA